MLYKEVEEFVVESFTNAGRADSIKHCIRTVYWLRKLLPDADEVLRIAAVSHDIERAYMEEGSNDLYRTSKDGFLDKEFLKRHQEKSAEIMAEFLKKKKGSETLVERVVHLISKHEEGGDEDQNLLKDADSISFFECNADRFVEKHAKEVGKAKVKRKLTWMYKRITSPDAKKYAEPLARRALKRL